MHTRTHTYTVKTDRVWRTVLVKWKCLQFVFEQKERATDRHSLTSLHKHKTTNQVNKRASLYAAHMPIIVCTSHKGHTLRRQISNKDNPLPIGPLNKHCVWRVVDPFWCVGIESVFKIGGGGPLEDNQTSVYQSVPTACDSDETWGTIIMTWNSHSFLPTHPINACIHTRIQTHTHTSTHTHTERIWDRLQS